MSSRSAPKPGILDGTEFEVAVEYDGVPEALVEFGGASGFMPTEDGVMVLGEPHVASTWFPANDHPIDKASFSFSITAPEDLEVVANGDPRRHDDVRTGGPPGTGKRPTR